MQSPSSEANWFAASQEIPRISRNPKVHYRTHKRPPPVSILGQLNPVHIPTSHLLEIHPNIIHPSRPRSPQWSPSLRFSFSIRLIKMSESQIDYEKFKISFSYSGGTRMQWLPLREHIGLRFWSSRDAAEDSNLLG